MMDEASHSFHIDGENNLDGRGFYIAQSSRVPVKSFAKSMEELMHSWLQKPSSFYILHVTYFMVLGFSGAFVLWICPNKNFEHMTFIDALYCSTSAVTVTGLLSVRIQGLQKLQQTVILLLTVFGSQIFTSLLPLYARRLAYRRILANQAMGILSKLEDINNVSDKHEKEGKSEANEAIEVKVVAEEAADPSQESSAEGKRVGKNEEPVKHRSKEMIRHIIISCSEMVNYIWRRYIRRIDCMTILAERIWRSCKTEDFSQAMEISLWKSKYMEYRALTYLYRIVVVYFVSVQLGGIVLIQLYLCASSTSRQILDKNDVNKTFFSVYNCVTSFANAGFTLLDKSIIPFRNHAFILLLLSFIILLGNTMFGPCLWIIISLLQRFSRGSEKEIYTYLLANPRKCYTHLFPKNQTLWLIVTVIGFNTTQTMFFCILDWNSSALYGLGPAEKIVDALFQSAATRNAGTNVFNLTDLSPPMLVFIVGMMYISVYPIYLTRQKTRSFKKEEKAYTEHYDNQISVQSRKLLARDSAHIFIIVFLICILESNNISQDPLNYSIFNVIFEVISAFGNAGLSVGYSCAYAKSGNSSWWCQEEVPYSLSGKWNTGGKIMIVVSMFLGRHRGLPDSLDSALLLPRTLAHEEEFSSISVLTTISLNNPTLWPLRSRGPTPRTSFSTDNKTVTNDLQTPDCPQNAV